MALSPSLDDVTSVERARVASHAGRAAQVGGASCEREAGGREALGSAQQGRALTAAEAVLGRARLPLLPQPVDRDAVVLSTTSGEARHLPRPQRPITA